MIKAMTYRVSLIDEYEHLRVDFTTHEKAASIAQANKWMHTHPRQKWAIFVKELNNDYLNFKKGQAE